MLSARAVEAVRSAQSAAWVRSVTPMRWKTLVRWALTVFSLISSRRAICLFARPSATQREHLALARRSARPPGGASARAR